MNEEIIRAVETVLESKKYAALLPDVVQRVTQEEYRKGRRGKQLVKAAKAALHRDWGAFAARAQDVQSHASTAGRLGNEAELFAAIARQCPRVDVLWDAGCGLNPLNLHHMPWKINVYYAWDIDNKAISLVSDFFAEQNLPPCAKQADVLAYTPPGQADLLLLFQILPIAHRQDKAAVARLLSLPAQYMAVTLPTATLGGQRRGIEAHNEALMDDWAQQAGVDVLEKQIIGKEWLYVLKNNV